MNMEIRHLHQDDALYPPSLRTYLGNDAPATIATVGNLNLLQERPLAMFCSTRCPGVLILQTHDFMQRLSQVGRTVIGGFHSPVERECLRILLRSAGGIIICPARSLERMRMPAEWRLPLTERRLLILSPFYKERISADRAEIRNLFVSAIAVEVFVAHASKGSKTEALAKIALDWRKPLFTLANENNDTLIQSGASAITPEFLV